LVLAMGEPMRVSQSPSFVMHTSKDRHGYIQFFRLVGQIIGQETFLAVGVGDRDHKGIGLPFADGTYV
jgi:hypothetical protein